MSKPPEKIDGAKVIARAWAGDEPFGVLDNTENLVTFEIYGFAICQYPESVKFYRFSCDKNWESKQDNEYESAQEAKQHIPRQYNRISPLWISGG